MTHPILACASDLSGSLKAVAWVDPDCTATIIPEVLGDDSVRLDLGRAKRVFSSGQRKALMIRDTTCRAEGCDIPATWCEAHHLDPWSSGGRTDLSNALLLCSHHHHRVHDNGLPQRPPPQR